MVVVVLTLEQMEDLEVAHKGWKMEEDILLGLAVDNRYSTLYFLITVSLCFEGCFKDEVSLKRAGTGTAITEPEARNGSRSRALTPSPGSISLAGSMDKGKTKATENDDLDLELANLNPTITYRHLLSQVPHVK